MRPIIGPAFDPDQMNEREQADAYAAELRYYRPRGFSRTARDLDRANLEYVCDTMTAADDILTEWGRRVTRNPYLCFGPFPQGGAVGFYYDVDTALADVDMKVDSTAEVPRGFSGLVAQISDHGNVTIYAYSRGRSREVLSAV